MPRPLPSLALGAIALLVAVAAQAAKPAPDPWQAALAFDYNAASERFAELHRASPADTRVAIAYASSLLVRQPRTKANIRTAHALLLKTGESAAGDEAVLAAYLLARIELDHLDPARPDSARDRLERLRREHPGHPLADHAAVELAYLLAYTPAGIDTASLPAIEALLASVNAPDAARDIHSLIGGLHLRRLHNPAAALPHYVAARAVGYQQPLRDAATDLTIANLARETGDLPLARRHYAAFLASAPRDSRANTVRRILAALEAAQTAAR